MNYLLLSVLLTVLAINTYAQITSPIEVITKDGRTVILKPDGTWEFKKVEPQPSPNPIANSSKSGVATDSLPWDSSIYEVETIYNKLEEYKRPLYKDEFETTSQYEKRVSEKIQSPIISNLKIKDSFLLSLGSGVIKYDADSQKMLFLLPIKTVDSESKYDSDFEKNNQYSINLTEFKVWSGKAYEFTYQIFFNEVGNFTRKSNNERQGFSAEISINVEDAKLLKDKVKVVALVQFQEPYIANINSYIKEFQVKVIDIYFYNSETRKIIAKMSEAKNK